jgi:hypothetical protein
MNNEISNMKPLSEIFHDNKPLTAKDITEAERREHEAKTARLRTARLAKEKALEPPATVKPRSRPRRWP